VRENLPRPAGAAAAAPREPGKAAQARRGGNPLAFLRRFEPRFIADIIAELRKVTWPTFTETRYLTMVVAIVAVVVGLFLGVIDLGFGWVIEQVFFN
jgi:preprotein translocase subunit SecE